MRQFIIKVVLVGLAYNISYSTAWQQNIDVQPDSFKGIQIEASQVNPNEIPLLIEPISKDLTKKSFPTQPQIFPRDRDGPPYTIDESEDDSSGTIAFPSEHADNPVETAHMPSASAASPRLADFPSGSVDSHESASEADGSTTSMENIDTVIFRPLFGYRSQNVERRSIGGYNRQNRRGQATSSGAYGNYFSNPPPYLVYDRKTGAYHPYYYYPNSNNVRRG